MVNDSKRSPASKWLAMALLLGYAGVISYLMLYGFGRVEGSVDRYNLQPFHTIQLFWRYADRFPMASASNLLGNVFLFVPFGFLIPVAFGGGFGRMLLLHTLGVCLLEFLQLLTRRGSMDVDDLILNTLGAVIGYLLLVMLGAMRARVERT